MSISGGGLFVKDMAKLGITLMIVCAVAGFGLAVVHAKTNPVIQQRAEDDLLAAAKAAIPGADEIVTETQDGQTYWIGRRGGEVVGGAMQVSSPGFREPIVMMVGFDTEGKVSSVAIISISDTPGIGSRVNNQEFLARFVGVENPNKVDGIAGATVSSSGVKGGVSKAVEFLGAILAPQSAAGPIDLAAVPDGTYKGTGDGLMGPIEVSVTVSGGKVTEVKVLSNSETPDVAGGALKQVPQAIVEKQSVKVDAVSGATFTSKGILEAVRQALVGAPAK